MKISTSIIAALALAAAAVPAQAGNVAMFLGANSVDEANSQEKAAASWFQAQYPEGILYTPATIAGLDAAATDVLWINVDRLGIAMGPDNLGEVAGPAAVATVKAFVEAGGNVFLSKHATQLISSLGRLPQEYEPHIFSSGDGGAGTDVWTVNAYLGSVQHLVVEPDLTQVYDRRGHAIYEGMETMAPEVQGYAHESFPLLGTGTGEAMHREDHNCCWDLNAYTWSAEGKNTLEQFESQFDCTVLGTWGHVADYCVAGIVEFAPAAEGQGTIIANGLAAYEWAPRNGGNAYQANIELLSANTINYLAGLRAPESGIAVAAAAEGEAVYYNMQGVRVANPEKGLFVRVQGGKASKVIL